ncbi:Uncharacterized protein Adt_31479 [Abeliophyllum distichum]|uniref:Retrotransposon gag domain-containing protein n=1 Tax=Abeliophyllum distichum TaxID=126358 RepID=A0ABD1RE74_9LAMI
MFQDRVRLHGWPDAIACRAFPMTLRKDAREWFDTLPPRSISSFADFANKFAICFSSSARKKKTAMGLMQVTQDKGESLARVHVEIQSRDPGYKKLANVFSNHSTTQRAEKSWLPSQPVEKTGRVDDRITMARRGIH